MNNGYSTWIIRNEDMLMTIPQQLEMFTQVLTMKKKTPTHMDKKCKTSENHTLPGLKKRKNKNSPETIEYHRYFHWAAAAFGAHFKCSGISKPQSFSGKDNQPTWQGPGPGKPDSLAKWQFFWIGPIAPVLSYGVFQLVMRVPQARWMVHNRKPSLNGWWYPG